jgi:hypothetical protein
MFVATIGIPTSVPHLRVVINPSRIERTPRRCERNSFHLYINEAFGWKPETAQPAHDWVDQFAIDLARRTCNGTIAKGTYRYINHYPTPSALHAANERLAAQGIKMDINPSASEDGTIMVWVEYTRQPGFNS